MNQHFLTKLMAYYPEAEKSPQLLVIVSHDTVGRATLFQQYGHVFMQRFSCPCRTGLRGLGKEKEGDGKTPLGLFPIGRAFGVLPDPGTRLSYTQLTPSHYWVDDPKSRYYNRFVCMDETILPDWQSAEHLFSQRAAYAYALSLAYNAACVPNKGSAIFLHCGVGRATKGCISLPQSAMRHMLVLMHPQAKVLIAGPDVFSQGAPISFV